MIRFPSVEQVDDGVVTSSCYDLGIFATGYEERCTHAAAKLSGTSIERKVVLGFDTFRNDETRISNDRFFLEEWGLEPHLAGGNDDRPILRVLNEITHTGEEIRVLVDYSSMSRVWYASVLNWARHASSLVSIHIDFLYSPGRYVHRATPMVIDEIITVPGFEGVSAGLARSVAVFGLGFDEFATLCVLDRLEADALYTIVPGPGTVSGYPEHVRELNREIITQSKATVEVAANNAELALRYVTELVKPYVPDWRVTLVPMGPKPHVLASLLVCLHFPQACCLRVSSARKDVDRVLATGPISVTRVRFAPSASIES